MNTGSLPLDRPPTYVGPGTVPSYQRNYGGWRAVRTADGPSMTMSADVAFRDCDSALSPREGMVGGCRKAFSKTPRSSGVSHNSG